MRIVGVFLVAGFYLVVSPQSELMYFWEVVFRPLSFFRLPARELALVMVIAVRFLPVMLAEIDRIRMAQTARGARLGKAGIFSTAAAMMPLMIPTLAQAIIRAEELAEAMEARGYRVAGVRTRYQQYIQTCRYHGRNFCHSDNLCSDLFETMICIEIWSAVLLQSFVSGDSADILR